jgi:hypothetical protein
MDTTTLEKKTRIIKLSEALPKLTDHQLDYIEIVLIQLLKPFIETYINPASDFMDKCVLDNFGDAIRIHHCFSNGPFSKDKFEYALEAVLNYCGIPSTLSRNGLPGYDIEFNNKKVSLKTEAEAKINKNKIHISKFMELGKGPWEIPILLDQFYKNLESYDRILTLRCLSKSPDNLHYELIEVPKELLFEAKSGRIIVMEKSTQNIKPAYCYVTDNQGKEKFNLYFDGGGERKLQVKNLDIKNCTKQAIWRFSINL